MQYDHRTIEKKWQERWAKEKTFAALSHSPKPAYYCLIEFPYPSGDGLHTGHIRSNTAMDIIARKRRAEGYNVLYPIGWDAFGLPTENYAVKTGIHPKEVTKKNTDTFRRQLQSVGFSFDWDREINTTDPAYYKWTQWIFLKLYAKGLAYKAKSFINWCPSCKIGLANEEAVGGVCERCGGPTEKREKEQWMLGITKYADRLDSDLDLVDYLEPIKIQQRNWIGKSTGSEIDFAISGRPEKITVFTTRADTLYGVTYLVLAPEYPHIDGWKDTISNWQEVLDYRKKTAEKNDADRTSDTREKTGVLLEGIWAEHPITKEKLPVWIADYVLPLYGTGAVMAVPAHDTRDWQFAQKYKLPVKEVVVPHVIDKRNPPVAGKKIVERKNVHAIVKDQKTGKYLALKWKKHDWITFPMGGIEDGEDVVAAAKREVKEETGFTNLTLVRVLPGQVRAEYFAAHKDENRVSYTTAVLFNLDDTIQEDVAPEEREMHEVIWLNESDINYEHMTHAEIAEWKTKLSNTFGSYDDEGMLIDSGEFSGLSSEEARKKITEKAGGKIVTKYKLRDWVFSRQRYWGEPIPIIFCKDCGTIPVPEEDLPVVLPDVEAYKPTDTGESPLAAITDWVRIPCPLCRGEARRETDTMPNWAGSSWYWLRYTDPKNTKHFADPSALKYWTPVSWYNGGMEHTTLHLLYSRFWHKFLFDEGLVPTPEPFAKRTSHGMILAAGGEKMSKSKGNVVNPDSVVETLGADTLRVYEMFMGPFDQAIPWSTEAIAGSRRFVERWFTSITEHIEKKKRETDPETKVLLEKTIKKVSDDIERMAFNTAISQLMIFSNQLKKENTSITKEDINRLVKISAPFIPHTAEELWEILGNTEPLSFASWPKPEEVFLVEEKTTISIQVNGRLKDTLIIETGESEEGIVARALAGEKIKHTLAGVPIVRHIYIPGRTLNFITSLDASSKK